MKYFEYMKTHSYEQLVLCQEPVTGLKAVIAIHDTTLGPALGGCRMWNYASEEEAIVDAFRLARGMTYKSAAAGLNLGGGKSVIIGDPRRDKTEALFRALGRFVQGLSGRYIVAEDVGTCVEDMEYIRMETSFVAGTDGASGDPSPATAYGVWQGMKACAREALGSESLSGRTVAVQGVGSVGHHLCRHLAEEGAKLVVADINPDAVQQAVNQFKAKPVEPEEIYSVDCDIFAPCALGAVLNDRTIPLLKAQIVAGSANNVLAGERHGELLEGKGILYAPDFIINAGGVINVADEMNPGGYDKDRAFRQVSKIGQTVCRVIDIARRNRVPTFRAAETLAEERIARLGKIKKSYVR